MLFLIFLVFTMKAHANRIQEVASCNNCNSQYDFLNVARQYSHPYLDLHVINVERGIAKRYLISQDDGGIKGGNISNNIVEVPARGDISSMVRNASNYRQQIQGVLSKRKVVDPSIAKSVYDIVDYSSNKNQAIEWFNNNSGVFDLIGGYAGVIASIVDISTTMRNKNQITISLSNINFSFTLYFSDGSRATMKINGLNDKGGFKMILVSAVDADGNNVILNKSDLATASGGYNFANEARAQRFMESLYIRGFMKSKNYGSVKITDLELRCDATTGECVLVKH